MKERISIGEMSEICGVSKRTLRFYDEINLVKPACISEDNGYRYYEPYQVGRVHLVKQLQELGASLDEVAECVRQGGTEINLDAFYACVKKREAKLNVEIAKLEEQKQIAKDYSLQYEAIKKQITDVDAEVHIQFLPERYLVHKSITGKLNPGMFGGTFAEIGSSLQNLPAPSHKLVPQIGACYIGRRNSEDCINQIGFFFDSCVGDIGFSVARISEGYYATYKCTGDYTNLHAYYQMLYTYLSEMNYHVGDFCVENYVMSPSLNLRRDEYVTEIQIPIFLIKPE